MFIRFNETSNEKADHIPTDRALTEKGISQ